MSENWAREEVIIIVDDYFDMLIEELSGKTYSKTEHRRTIQNKLNNRSKGAIEYKHQNISAILRELRMPYIQGYIPRYNYQLLLQEEVINYLNAHRDIDQIIIQFVESDVNPKEPKDLPNIEVSIPELIFKPEDSTFKMKNYRIKRDYYNEEINNTKLGLLGEKFVLSYEKLYLKNLGLSSFIHKIDHVSKTVGDSAGFDILSFDENGKEKFIEVKTTQMGKEVPFYFTRNELSFSRKNSKNYRLYRIFDFKRSPHFYQLKGTLDKSCESIPTKFMGWPK